MTALSRLQRERQYKWGKGTPVRAVWDRRVGWALIRIAGNQQLRAILTADSAQMRFADSVNARTSLTVFGPEGK